MFVWISWILQSFFFFLDLLLKLEEINKAVYLSYNKITNFLKKNWFHDLHVALKDYKSLSGHAYYIANVGFVYSSINIY